MPNGIDGQELLRRARALRPGLKALFTSGYSEQFIKGRGPTEAGVALLSKPYRTQKLAEAVRGALDGRDLPRRPDVLDFRQIFRGLARQVIRLAARLLADAGVIDRIGRARPSRLAVGLAFLGL